jgi:chorismate lyase/3-hydroxybenzoate synthase
MEYRISHQAGGRNAPDDRVLADITHGVCHLRDSADPRRIVIGTPPIANAPNHEVWRLPESTTTGWCGDIGYVVGGDFLFAHLLVPEPAAADLALLTQQAYARLLAFVRASRCPHLLRIWNYLSRINEYEQGIERYQAFCKGRAVAFAEASIPDADCPAATAIGSDAPGLSIHLLASRQGGTPIENPRQISAYCYPPTYGRRAPSFARAMLYAGPQQSSELAISGTASIVGHVTMHPHHLLRQLRETIRNLDRLIDNARFRASPRRPEPPAWLKVYLRDPDRVQEVDARLRAWAGGDASILYLRGAICRRALEIEIEGHYAVAHQDYADQSQH